MNFFLRKGNSLYVQEHWNAISLCTLYTTQAGAHTVHEFRSIGEHPNCYNKTEGLSVFIFAHRRATTFCTINIRTIRVCVCRGQVETCTPVLSTHIMQAVTLYLAMHSQEKGVQGERD